MRKGEARQQAKELRYRIGDTINRHLELANRTERIDMRSKRDIEKAELEQAQAELSQELTELEQLEQVTDFNQDDLTDVLARLQLEQAEIVVVPKQPERPRTADDYLASLKAQIKDTPEQPTVIDEYQNRRQTLAQGFFNRALKALSDKYNKIVAHMKEIEAKKPKVWQIWESQDIWQSKLDTATAERGDTKRAYHTLKQQGVSRVHFEQAERYIKEREPDLYNRYLSATEPEPEFIRSDKGIGTTPPPPERELSDKARIGLQTIKNVIDAMPDGDKKTKAMVEFERTQATATNAQLEALAQVDVRVNKQPDVVIQAPSQSQEQEQER